MREYDVVKRLMNFDGGSSIFPTLTHEEVWELRAEIARLRAELDTQRDSQISAVNQMLAAEQREAKLRAALERAIPILDKYGPLGVAEQARAALANERDK